jgi:hypothetical protein
MEAFQDINFVLLRSSWTSTTPMRLQTQQKKKKKTNVLEKIHILLHKYIYYMY